jgi:HEAT repeat protein
MALPLAFTLEPPVPLPYRDLVRTRLNYTLALLFVCALAWAGWALLRPDQPRYAGQPVSFWFGQYCQSGHYGNYDSSLREEAAGALQKMGTNALPFLLGQAFSTSEDTPLRKKLNQVSRGFPRWLPRFQSYEMVRLDAFQAIRDMKPPASLLLPEMEKWLSQTNTPARRSALYALGLLGEGAEEGVPALLSALGETNRVSRQLAVQSLMFLGPKASAAVPQLTELLGTAENRANHPYQSVAYALGAIGSNAAPALPALRELFRSETNQNGRTALAVALCQIDAQQDEALAFLVERLHDTREARRQWAAAANLGRIGPNAAAAVPALLETLDSPQIQVAMSAVDALQKIGVPNEILLPRLTEHLCDPSETLQVNFAARILMIEPGHAEAQHALLRLIQNGSIFTTFALDALGGAGPSASPVVPSLRTIAPAQSREIRERTLRTINRIESAQ